MPTFRLGWRSWASLVASMLIALGMPGASSAAPPANDGWAFAYPDHKAGDQPRLNLRSLNETVAGQSGFVRLSADGESFVLGDGTPARFWAIGSDLFHDHPIEEIRRHVQFLAGLGVNMVRLHAQLPANSPTSKVTDVDEKAIDGIWRFVAEAKKQGIYVTISPYWANGVDATSWGIKGYEGKGSLWGLLFYDETLQSGYKAWATALYGRTNPHTGISLAKDPAVALIQIQNEDSLLFWTTQTIKPPQKEALGRKFAAWLTKKSGSLDAARKSWGGASVAGDDFASGKVGLTGMYEMTIRPPGGMGRRVADQVAFFAETQKEFYVEMARYHREDLGCRQLINASNWRTASQTLLDDSERWSYAASTDVVAVNRYYNGGAHVGNNQGWRIDPGDHFSSRSAVLNPRELPTNLKQVMGHPMVITESTWVTPLAYQSEGPFLAAVYESLTGVDAFYWFSADAVDYKTSPHFPYQQVQGQQPLLKWSASIPPILGGFPANALLFRKGYVKKGEPVVHEERPLQTLWDREPPLLAEDPSFDPNRDQARPVAPRPGEKPTVVDPLAFLAGPVEIKYGGDPSKNRVADLAKLIDPVKKVVRSITGEVVLDYGVGLCTVDTPKAQGACGFLSQAGPIRLKDVAIKSKNVYATVVVVPLDDQPLATSKRILVQVGTAARPTGWATKDAEFAGEGNKPTRGFEVVKTGKPPWRIADTEVNLTITNPGLTRSTLLDPAGYASKSVPITKANGGVVVNLPAETMYLILE